MLTQMNFHSATISTIFKHYNSLLMLQSSPFNVNFANKIPKFIGFMKLACRFGRYKEKNGSSCIFTSSGILKIPKTFIKVIRGLPVLEALNFQSSGFLKALQYTENPNHLQILPGIKVWSWY